MKLLRYRRIDSLSEKYVQIEVFLMTDIISILLFFEIPIYHFCELMLLL